MDHKLTDRRQIRHDLDDLRYRLQPGVVNLDPLVRARLTVRLALLELSLTYEHPAEVWAYLHGDYRVWSVHLQDFASRFGGTRTDNATSPNNDPGTCDDIPTRNRNSDPARPSTASYDPGPDSSLTDPVDVLDA